MSSDFALVLGTICFALAFPPLLGAFSSGRPPRTSILLFVVAGGLILWALSRSATGYTITELPQVYLRVFRGLVN